MKKLISLLLVFGLLATFTACDKKEDPIIVDEASTKKALEDYLAVQVQAYKDAFGIQELSVDVQITEFEVHNPHYDMDGKLSYPGHIYCTIRDVVVCPTITEKLENGQFDDTFLQQLSAISFTYPKGVGEGLPLGDYLIRPYSRLALPVISDGKGNEYVPAYDILTKNNIYMYISPNANLEIPARVGQSVSDAFADYNAQHSGSTSSSNRPIGAKCPNCNGSGYVKYHYGDSDLQAYLDGYPPYTVGKCPLCDGTGR